MPTLVSLDTSGAIIPLAPGSPVTIGVGANTTTIPWTTLWNMANTSLNALNIYMVADPSQTPANNQMVCGVVYEHVANTIVATALLQNKPVVNTTAYQQVLVISRRQFFQQLALDNIITADEALAAVKTGTTPAAMQHLINTLPANTQFSANMLIAGATDFNLTNPITETLSSAFGWTQSQLYSFWTTAASL